MLRHMKTWGDGGGYREGNWPRLKAAIEFQEAFGEGLGSGATPDPVVFEDHWPERPDAKPAHFQSVTQYLAWRTIMISGLEAFSGRKSRRTVTAEEERDVWLRLRNCCKERGFGPAHENNILALRRFALSAGVSPVEVTKHWAESFQKGLNKTDRAMFRAGIRALDKARVDAKTRDAFGLSRELLGRLEKKLSPNEERPLPPRLSSEFEAWLESLGHGEPVGFRGRRRPPVSEATLRQYRFAIAWYWRSFSKAFPGHTDPEMALLAGTETVQKISRNPADEENQQDKPDFKVGYFAKVLPFLHRWNPLLAMPKQEKERRNER